MADYYCVSRTNYFKVKKINDFKKELEDLAFCEGGLQIWDGKDGRVGLGAYGSITTYYDEEADDMHEIFPILQDHLADGEVVILVESGYEKLRYITGFAWVVTKDDVKFIDVLHEAVKEALLLTGKTADELLPQY
jgi:hypothetical protein